MNNTPSTSHYKNMDDFYTSQQWETNVLQSAVVLCGQTANTKGKKAVWPHETKSAIAL